MKGKKDIHPKKPPEIIDPTNRSGSLRYHPADFSHDGSTGSKLSSSAAAGRVDLRTAAKYGNRGVQPQSRATASSRCSLGKQRRSWAAPVVCIQVGQAGAVSFARRGRAHPGHMSTGHHVKRLELLRGKVAAQSRFRSEAAVMHDQRLRFVNYRFAPRYRASQPGLTARARPGTRTRTSVPIGKTDRNKTHVRLIQKIMIAGANKSLLPLDELDARIQP